MNLIVLKGRLTADPEIKVVGAKQTKVCNFSIAVNRRFEKDKADFINCQAWGNTAEFVAKYFSKGKEMSLTGELHIDQHEENGAKKYFTRVKVDAVEFCGSKNEDNNSSVAPTSMSAPAPADFEEIDDDDLPFA
jgi:single-strand DNA-binding protein